TMTATMVRQWMPRRRTRNQNPRAATDHPQPKQESIMKLYGFPASPNTWKVRALASHLGINLDFVLVDLTKPRTAEYLTVHPAGRTPALVDGDFVLTESNAIMQY